MSFTGCIRYLKFISVFFALQGVLWSVLGQFDPFGLYDQCMARAFFQRDSLDPHAERVFRFILGPFGATSAGYFILQYYIVAYTFPNRERWGLRAVTTAFLVWFLLDTVVSLWRGALFNVLLANIPALFMTLPALYFARMRFDDIVLDDFVGLRSKQ